MLLPCIVIAIVYKMPPDVYVILDCEDVVLHIMPVMPFYFPQCWYAILNHTLAKTKQQQKEQQKQNKKSV